MLEAGTRELISGVIIGSDEKGVANRCGRGWKEV